MTTILTTALSVDDAVTAYAAMSTGEKARFRSAVVDAAMAAVTDGDIESATHYGAIRTALKSAAKPESVRDYAGELSDMAATLEEAALSLRVTGIDVDGVTYRATNVGTADDAKVASFTTLRAARAARSANGAVAAFIAEHVTDTPRTVAELLNDAPIDAYRPSTGAIGACLVRVANGTEEVDGFAVADKDGRRAAVAV